MKNTLAFLLLTAVAFAADWRDTAPESARCDWRAMEAWKTNPEAGNQWVAYFEKSGAYYRFIDDGLWPARGYTVATAQQYTSYTNAVALAQAAADAAAASNAAVQAAMPQQFPTGVAVPVPDANGHFMLLQPQSDGEPIVGIQISDSPINPATWQARKAAALATNTVVTSTYRQTLREIRSNLATNKVEVQAIDPTDSSNAAQKAQIQALKRELIDLLVEVQNLRQALARKEREE